MQIGVEMRLDELDVAEQLPDTLERVVLARIGISTSFAATIALTVSSPRDGGQSMRMKSKSRSASAFSDSAF